MKENLALIVGGRGGIGAFVTKAFVAAGWPTVVVGREDGEWPDNPAVIVNAAGAGINSNNRSDASHLTYVNVDVAERAGLLAASTGARLVQLGTPLVRTPLLELGDLYVETKSRASALLCVIPNLDLVELHPHLVVGTPGCWVTRITMSLRAGVAFGLRTPYAERDVIHVSEVARAVVLAATGKHIYAQPLEIGTGRAISMAGLVSTVAGLLGSETGWYQEPCAPQPWDGSLVADPEPAARALGFRTELTINHAVRNCMEHCAGQPFR